MAIDYESLCNSQVIDRNEEGHTSSKEKSIPAVTVWADAFQTVTKENRFRLFNICCPVCGRLIIGRPCEWPYYIRMDDKYLWLCDKCGYLRHVNVCENESEDVVARFDLRSDGHHEKRDLK